MKFPRFFVYAIAFFATAALAESKWVFIASSTSKQQKFEIKSGSLEISKTRSGTPIAVVIGRDYGPSTSKIDVWKAYVPLKDCISESGIIVTTNMAGEYQYQNEFVFDGGSVASGLAEAICSAAKSQIKEASDKSL